jgi:hypothetical protein
MVVLKHGKRQLLSKNEPDRQPVRLIKIMTCRTSSNSCVVLTITFITVIFSTAVIGT